MSEPAQTLNSDPRGEAPRRGPLDGEDRQDDRRDSAGLSIARLDDEARPPEPSPVEAAENRRPGRFRRLILRPLLWGLAGLAILIFVVQLYIDTPRVRNWVRQLASAELSRVLDREVRIDDISIVLLPFTVEVWGFSIAGPEPGDANFLEVPWAAVDADFGALQRRVFRLRQIRAERPRMHLQFLPDHHNLITFPRSKRERRFDVWIDRIEVDQAEFFLDQESVELSISADAVRARLQGRGHLEVYGQVAAQNVNVRLPNARPQSVAVSIEGTAQPGKITIEDARVTAPDFSAEAHGSCGWPRQDPKDKKCLILAQGQGEGRLLDRLGYFSDLTGEIEFDGTLVWRPGTFGWRSTVRGDRLFAWNRPLSGLRATLAADRYGVNSLIEEARYAGGTLRGTIGYQHRSEGRPVDVKLQFENLDLDTVLADQAIPAHGFASRLEGQIDYRFPLAEPRRGDGGGEVQVLRGRPGNNGQPETGPPPTPPDLPLSGAFPLRISGGVVRSESIRLQGDFQSALADGWFDLAADRGAFDYEILTADLAQFTELLPFLDRSSESIALWLPRTGEGSLAGTLFIEPGDVATDLQLRLENVETASLSAPRLTGGLFVDTREVRSLHLELGDDERALMMSGRVPLLEENVGQGIEMSFDAVAWPLDEIRPWVPFELPFDGPVSGRLELLIGPESSVGRLRARAEPVTLYPPASPYLPLEPQIAFETLSTQLDWDAEVLRISQMSLEGPAGRMTAQGTAGFRSERYDLNLRSSWLRLEEEPFASYLPRGDLGGAMVITAHLGGEFSRPDLDLVVEAPSLRLGERELGAGPSRLELKWNAGQLRAEGQLLDWIELRGGGPLDRQRADIRLQVEGHDLGSLAEVFIERAPADLEGHFSGELHLTGTAAAEAETGLDLVLDELEVLYRDRTLRNLEPVALRLGGETLTIEALALAEAASDSSLTLSGEMGYEADSALDLQLQAAIATSWLQLAVPELETTGSFTVSARVGGTVGDPHLDGRGEIHSSRSMVPTIFPHSLDEVHGRLRFTPRAITVESLEARLAGGTLSASGRFAPPWRAGAPDYRLTIDGEDLRLRYPEGWTLEGDAELVLQSLEEGQLLSGRAELTQIRYFEDLALGFTQLMEDFFQRQRLEVKGSGGVLSTTQLNVELQAPQALEVRNNLVDLSGSVDLLLRGNLIEPVLYGEVEIDPGGLLVYNNNDYDIDRGRLIFSSPYELAPEVDLVANTKVREVEITMALSGTLERLDARFASEPPLPDLEVFRLLATGGSVDSDIEAVRRFERLDEDQSTSAASFLYGQAASVIGQRVNTLFGFDKFRIDPLTGSGDNLSTARLTVGKRLSRDVFVSYSLDPTSTEEPRLRLEWQVGEDLTLVLTQNGDNSYSADARWETSF